MNLYLHAEIIKSREKKNLYCGIIIIIIYALGMVVYIYSSSILEAEASSKPDWAVW